MKHLLYAGLLMFIRVGLRTESRELAFNFCTMKS